jgi:hypothetical protein
MLAKVSYTVGYMVGFLIGSIGACMTYVLITLPRKQ